MDTVQFLFLTLLGLSFVAAALAPVLHRWLGDRLGLLLAVVPLAQAAFYISLIPAVAAGETFLIEAPWVPAIGLGFEFLVDGLALLFLLLVSIIGFFVVLYAQGYLHGKRDLGRFFLALFVFMGGMLGIVASDNLILLFVFWELTSISSYLLIGYYHEKEDSRKSALQALLVTGAGGLAMLGGFILLIYATGETRISAMIGQDFQVFGGDQPYQGLYPLILVLILLGAFTKSAQFPFHFWLPNAMAAPAPVSSFLHSATMVKAGVFLLARMHPVLDIDDLWTQIVAPVGAITMVTGVVLGMGQTDLKKILAYTTVSVLGTLTMLLGLGTDLAIKAALTYLLAHALYKAALFMTAGAVDHETGERSVDALGGLRGKMPWTCAAALMAAISMAGLPFAIGFLGKEYFYKAVLYYETGGVPIWEILAVGASILMVSLAFTAGIKPYFGTFKETPKHAHEAPWLMRIGPILLALAGLKTGLFPTWVSDNLILPATRNVSTNPAFDSVLKYPESFNTALILSIITILSGLALYQVAVKVRQRQGLFQTLGTFGPEGAYNTGLNDLLRFATWQTRFLQHGYLRIYLLVIVLFATFAPAVVLLTNPVNLHLQDLAPVQLTPAFICAVVVVASIYTAVARARITAIVSLGVVGLSIALLFLIFSAADLALTQLLVEALTVILFVLAFYKLPQFKKLSPNPIRWRDAAVAAVFGLVMALTVLVALHLDIDQPVSEFYAQNSFTEAKGRNVVNVILVDFRALDTLGEITVLAIAALGIYALLKLDPRRLRPRKKGEPST